MPRLIVSIDGVVIKEVTLAKDRTTLGRRPYNDIVIDNLAVSGEHAVLHMIAMARAVDVPLSIDDFQKVSDRVPFIADLKPSGKYVMEDLHHVGGTPAVMKYLLEKGLLDGSCLTVTGKSMAQNLVDVKGFAEGHRVIHKL